MKIPRLFLRVSVVGACLFVMCIGLIPIWWQSHVHASGGTTYYVNNQNGSNCNDATSGTNPSSPFCDFTPINAHGAFGPGDHILLACGANWTMGGTTPATMVQLSGSGASGNPIVLDAYDPGNPSSDQCNQRPQLFGNSVLGTVVILIHNPSFWTVSNLELGYGTVGLSAFFTQTGNQDYTVTNLYVHDFNGYTTFTCDPTLGTNQGFGILLGGGSGTPSSSPSNPLLSGFTAEYIEGAHNQESLGETCAGYIANVVMDHIYLHDNNGSNANDPSSNGNGANCSDAFRPANMVHALIYDVFMTNNLGCPNPTRYGTASIFAQGSSDMTLANSAIQSTLDSGSSDQTGMDFENGNSQVHIRDSYFGGNAGPGLEVLGIHGSSDYQTQLEFSGNTFDHNGTAGRGSYVGGMAQIGSDTVPTGTIMDNLYAESGGFLNGNFSGFSQSNNLDASSGPRVYNAAHDFSGTQGQNGWSYQTSNNGGASWNNFSTYNGGSFPIWNNGTPPWPYITQFDMGPGDNTWVSRTWTAPATGTLSIRGRAFKADIRGGDGVGVRILLNGAPIFNRQTIGATNQVGIATNLDNVLVHAGDVLRFIVDPGDNGNSSYDMTSWTPSIGYTAVSSNSLAVADSGFETPGVGNGNFAYSQNISGGNWTFGPAYGSGISSNGSGFTSGNPNAPEGSQVAFLQRGGGTISQAIGGFSSGTTYTLTFYAAQRGNCCGAGNEDFQVLLDGTVIGTFTPTGTAYTQYSTSFTTTAGTHTLTFQGLDSGGGDRTAFIDNVRIIY